MVNIFILTKVEIPIIQNKKHNSKKEKTIDLAYISS